MHIYPITEYQIACAMGRAVVGHGCVYVFLPSLDLPGDPPAIKFDTMIDPWAVFDAIVRHHVPNIRSGEIELVKKQTHPLHTMIQ